MSQSQDTVMQPAEAQEDVVHVRRRVLGVTPTDADPEALAQDVAARVLAADVEEITAMLANQTLRVEDSNELGWTPLHAAVSKGDVQLVRLLLAHGADVNVADQSGSPALHYAASFGLIEVMSELLAAGADVNALDKDGTSTVQHAMDEEQYAATAMLVGFGADLNHRTHAFPSVLDCARKLPKMKSALAVGLGQVKQRYTAIVESLGARLGGDMDVCRLIARYA